MTGEDFLIDGPEVDGVLQVASVVQRGQAWLRAEQSALHRVADEQQWSRGAVVGAAACVLLRPPAELGPSRDEHLVRHVVGGEVLVERGDRGVEVAHQVVVAVELGVVRVETARGYVQQLYAGGGGDEVGPALQRGPPLVFRRIDELYLFG